MDETGRFLGFIVALAPAAFVAYFAKSRSVFAWGVLGAIVGWALAGDVMMSFGGDATRRDRIISAAMWDAAWTIPGALIGAALPGWYALRKAWKSASSRE